MKTNRRLTGLALVGFAMWALGAVHAWSQVPETERQALIELYNATSGDAWSNDDGWLGEEGTECDWYGVDCLGTQATRYVASLRLSNNGLVGVLSEQLLQEHLAEMDQLQSVRLDSNDLHGPLPAGFGEFASLEYLYLSNNEFSGPVPGSLVSAPLRNIDLASNQLDGYTEAGDAETGEPEDANLWLVLSDNPMETLPPESWRSANAIAVLEMVRTGLSGEIDFDHHPWASLTQLNLSENGITRLVGIDAGTLVDLKELNLARNTIVNHWPISGQTLPELITLDLRANGLSIPPPSGLSAHPTLRELQLANNALTATGLEDLFVLDGLTTLNLANNPIQSLPEEVPGAPDASNLDLSQTQLAGVPPAWFGELTLRTLNLSGNHLTGSLEPWLAAMQGSFTTRLNLSRNQFDGELPAALTEIEFANKGLALCWNHFDEPSTEEMASFLETAHRDGSLANCNDRDLAEIDLTISGSWYNPERPGQGYTVMLLDSGQVLHYWFGFPRVFDTPEDRQMWSFEMTAADDSAAVFPPSLVPYGGQFEQGLAAGRVTPYGDRALEMIRLSEDLLSVYSGWRVQGRRIAIDPTPARIHERFEHGRLSELAGTTCQNQSRFQKYSGVWYNPDRSGEGFVLEVLPDGRGLVYWFTYTPDGAGRQAWMIGDGVLDGPEIVVPTHPQDFPFAEIEIENMFQPVGTVMGPDFDSSEIDTIDWGSLRLEFYREGGRVFWDSQIEGYGSGDYPIERLARPRLADCD